MAGLEAVETGDGRDAAAGKAVATLSREIVQLHARAFGRGPTKARSYIGPGFAFCLLENVLNTAERTLAENGAQEQVDVGSDTELAFFIFDDWEQSGADGQRLPC